MEHLMNHRDSSMVIPLASIHFQAYNATERESTEASVQTRHLTNERDHSTVIPSSSVYEQDYSASERAGRVQWHKRYISQITRHQAVVPSGSTLIQTTNTNERCNHSEHERRIQQQTRSINLGITFEAAIKKPPKRRKHTAKKPPSAQLRRMKPKNLRAFLMKPQPRENKIRESC